MHHLVEVAANFPKLTHAKGYGLTTKKLVLYCLKAPNPDTPLLNFLRHILLVELLEFMRAFLGDLPNATINRGDVLLVLSIAQQTNVIILTSKKASAVEAAPLSRTSVALSGI